MGLLLQSAWGPLALGGPQTEQTFRRDRDRRRSTQLPLQSYAPDMAPLAAPAAPSLTPLAAAPDKQALAPAQGGGFLNRLAGLPENSLFQMGMSFLGNAQNGGNWAGALQSMQEASRAQLERQRMQNEMRRGKVTEQREGDVYSRQQQEWRRQDERRQSMDAWLGTLSPEQQAAARANPEAAHEAFMEAQAASSAPITPYQQAQLDLARRGLAIDAYRARNDRSSSLSPAQQRLYRNDYEGTQQSLADQVGPQVMSSMSWATQIGRNGEVPQGVPMADVLVNDQGLLRAVARLQTGVGVLTEGEVRDTVGNNLANQLQAQGAAFNLSERLRPEVRAALARLVQDGARRVSTRAWSARENAVAAYNEATGENPVGWSLPQFAHPEDMASLNAAERIAGSQGAPSLRPNDVRIAPSGREYRYVGRGNWLPTGEGNLAGYQAGRQQRLEAAPQTSAAPQQPQAGSQVLESLPPAANYREGYRMENDRGIIVEVRNGRWVRVGGANQGARQREVTGGVR